VRRREDHINRLFARTDYLNWIKERNFKGQKELRRSDRRSSHRKVEKSVTSAAKYDNKSGEISFNRTPNTPLIMMFRENFNTNASKKEKEKIFSEAIYVKKRRRSKTGGHTKYFWKDIF
jgi:hypothetical protein